MVIKVIHILNHLEKIDRDIKEIEQMRNQLQLDRTYTAVVKDSLNTEMARLSKLQQTIGTLAINNPPDHLVIDIKDHVKGIATKPISQLLAASKRNNSIPKVDITPSSQKTQEDEPNDSVNKPSEASSASLTKQTTSKKKPSTSNRDTTGFQWKFVQK